MFKQSNKGHCLALAALLLGGQVGCVSAPERPTRSYSPPVGHPLNPPGPSTFRFHLGMTINLPGSAVLAGYPKAAKGSVEGHIESKVSSTDPLRSRTQGSLEIEIVGNPDTFTFALESDIDEERDGPPADSFTLIGKLINQAVLSAQSIGSFPTTQPAK